MPQHQNMLHSCKLTLWSHAGCAEVTWRATTVSIECLLEMICGRMMCYLCCCTFKAFLEVDFNLLRLPGCCCCCCNCWQACGQQLLLSASSLHQRHNQPWLRRPSNVPTTNLCISLQVSKGCMALFSCKNQVFEESHQQMVCSDTVLHRWQG